MDSWRYVVARLLRSRPPVLLLVLALLTPLVGLSAVWWGGLLLCSLVLALLTAIGDPFFADDIRRGSRWRS